MLIHWVFNYLMKSGMQPMNFSGYPAFEKGNWFIVTTCNIWQKKKVKSGNSIYHNNIIPIRKVEWVFKNGVGYDSKKTFESVRGKVGFY